jgi:hypothetical protein
MLSEDRARRREHNCINLGCIVTVTVPEMVAPAMQTGRVPARSTSRAVSGPEKKYIATCRDKGAVI